MAGPVEPTHASDTARVGPSTSRSRLVRFAIIAPGGWPGGGWAAQQSHTLPLWQSSFVHVAGAACHESFCRSDFSHTALDVPDVWDKCMVVRLSHRTQPCALNSSPTTASQLRSKARAAWGSRHSGAQSLRSP